MSKVLRVILLALVAVVAMGQMLHVSADEKLTIKQIMEKSHKGKEAPIQVVLAGKADEKLLKEFLSWFESMAAQKPELGDEASWKTKTAALVEATKGLIEKKPNALETMTTASDCKACHSIHKPKKK